MIEALTSRWGRWRGGALAVPLAIVVAGWLLAISEYGYHRAQSELQQLVQLGQARLELTRILTRVGDAESSQRGYLLAGTDEYLVPFRRASVDVQASVDRLRQLLAAGGDARSRDDVGKLVDDVNAKLSEMDTVVGLHAAGDKARAHELMLSGIGRDQMDSIRTRVDGLMRRQNERIATGLANVFDTMFLNRVGIGATTAVSLLALGMYLRQRRELEGERAARQARVQAERDRLEEEVRVRTAELTDLARHLETAREDERARLARDLHDELGALLTAAKLDVARMRPKLQQAAPDLLPRVAHLVETLNSGIALKRRIIEDLRPSTLANLGLLPALEVLCQESAERLALPIDTAFTAVRLPPEVELTVFRLVQESLNNIAKHAQARSVRVTLAAQGEQAQVTVEDDGVGFDPRRVAGARHGLMGMRYRVEAAGGRLEVVSGDGTGTAVRASLPQRPAAPAAPAA